MSPGEVAEVYCPGELDQGGNINIYSHVNENEWSHVYTDMKYIFEVEDCSLKVEDREEPKIEKVTGPIEPGRCIFVVSEQFDNGGTALALQRDTADAYAPRGTGVYNVHLGKWDGTGSTLKT